MVSTRRSLYLLLLVMLGLPGCRTQSEYPDRPIVLICPWAAGGGTDRVSRQLAVHLEHELGVPVSVVNATGGKGVTGHSRGLHAKSDGYTLTMATLELNMMHWADLTDLDHTSCIPIMSVNEDYAALFVGKDAPWKSLAELEAAIRDQPNQLRASGTASGGAWHLALAGWLLAGNFAADDVAWISSTGAGPSLQELLSGGLDMVCCSLPEAESLYRSGVIRALGVMSPARVTGYEDVPTFAEQGRDWTLGGWRGLAVPLNTPPQVVDRLQTTMRRIVTGESSVTTAEGEQTFPQFMQEARFDATWRASDDFGVFLAENDRKFGKLLLNPAMQSVSEDRYSPYAFPGMLVGLMVLVGIGVAVGHRSAGKLAAADSETVSTDPPQHDRTQAVAEDQRVSRRGLVNGLLVFATVVGFSVVADTVGFILTAGVTTMVLLVAFGNRVIVSIATAAIFIPLVYHVFAHLLRVPLPRGWLGW